MNNAYIRAQQCKVKEAKFPFVKIGTQYWTTKNLSLSVTPQGNTIPEMQANGNVEKITNGGFESGFSNWVINTPINITNEIINYESYTNVYHLNSINTPSGLYQTVSSIILGRKYKLSYNIKVVSGAMRVQAGGISMPTMSTDNSSNWTTIVTYFTAASNSPITIYTNTGGAEFYIDYVSCQEIGWSGSQELYDGIYAQTSGTVEQKTYAAVKAAAMWCHYNNDVDNGAIYGKLYNWFAVKLLQMDIDYYNAANPTTPWGWRIPTQAEFQTLSTYLGGNAVSGGHLKEAGLAHWNSPNTGADNSSGFSALGGGFRNPDGSSTALTVLLFMRTTNNIPAVLKHNTSDVELSGQSLIRGMSLRLIKA